MANGQPLYIAAVADIHYGKTSQGTLQALFAEMSTRAGVIVLAGDLTDYGLPDEARTLAKDLQASVNVPVLAVLGNHDYESGEAGDVRQVMIDAGVIMLDGESCEVEGVGFAGVKGFCGGFEQWLLAPWGEATIKSFVQESVAEALKLESALYKLATDRRVAILHYAPIRDTVQGENSEIFPFLGCSRLEDPLARFPVSVAFHGHAHNGQPEGRTRSGVPVYNVSMQVLKRAYPDRPPYCLFALPPFAGGEEPDAGI